MQTISAQLEGTTLQAFWANLAFTLAVVITQPLYVSASNIIGRKPLLYAAFFLFGLGSLVFALAPNMEVVIAGRLVAGLGGGGLDVLNEVLMCDITTLKERPLWMGIAATPMAVGVILGPIVGALLTDYVSWRWLGWMNLPLTAISAGLAFFFMDLRPLEGSARSRMSRLDWRGMGLFAAGSTMFALPLSWAGSLYPWSSWRTILPLVIGLAILLLFGVYESRPAEPVVPYRFFKSRTTVAIIVGGFFHGMVLYPLTLYMPLFFQAVNLESSMESAVSMLPSACVLIAFSIISGVVILRIRRYLWLLWAAWVFMSLGTGLFALWDGASSAAAYAGYQSIVGIGLGILFGGVPALAIQASVSDPDDQGFAIGIMVSFRLFGALVGLAVSASAFSSVFSRSFASLEPFPSALSVLQDPGAAVNFIPHLRDLNLDADAMDAVRAVYNNCMRAIWYIMTGFGVLGFASSLLVEELSIETQEVGRQHLE